MDAQFATDPDDIEIIGKIADRAEAMDRQWNGKRAMKRLHHMMNVSACHASGNPLRLADLLSADDFNFAHDVFGIDQHLNHETGRLMNFFTPRFSRPASDGANAA